MRTPEDLVTSRRPAGADRSGRSGPGRRAPGTARRLAEGSRSGLPALPANEVLLYALVSVLVVIGLVMVLSSSSVDSLRQYGSSLVIFDHQLLWVAIGIVILAGASRFDYRRWQRWGGALLVVCLVLLLAVLVPHVGVKVNGSSRWLGAGSLTFQPSELTKLALALFGADVLARRACRGRPWGPAVRPVVIAFLVVGLLILAQPDMGTVLVIGCITLGLLYAAGIPGKALGGLLGGAGVLAFVLGMAMPYRRARLLSFLDPWAHRSNSGYQEVQSLIGFANGHLLGVGLGGSTSKFGFLPNAHTDFIFSVIGAELGLIGTLLILALFVALAVVGLRVAARAPDRYGFLLAVAITCWLIGQAVLNMGAVIGMLPVTGVPLPFISYGGSSLVFEMAAAGILINIARRGHRPAPARTRRDGRQRRQPVGSAQAWR